MKITMKRASLLLVCLLITQILYGCSAPLQHGTLPEGKDDPTVESSPASGSQGSDSSSHTLLPESVDSIDTGENALPASSSSDPGSTIPSRIDSADISTYTETLSLFFHSPIKSSHDIPKGYSLAFYLLYQTFTANDGHTTYAQDENTFWKIPEEDIVQTAKDYLGLSDFSISDITEWPFGDPHDDFCYYTEETSLPYCDSTGNLRNL